jgi:hypothetical protein
LLRPKRISSGLPVTRGNRRQVLMALPMPVPDSYIKGAKDEIVEEVESQSLLRQTDPTNQFCKARVGVERIQTCVGRKVFHQCVRALLVGTIEPGERLIFFP